MPNLCEDEIKKIVDLYVNSHFSVKKIWRTTGIDRRKVSKALRAREIKILGKEDAMRLVNTKHTKSTFSGSEEEKAYLLGLVKGDFYAMRKSKYTLRLTTGTTHDDFLNLVRSVFSKYGPIHIYPTKQNEEYKWNVCVDLDLSSFEFLHKPGLNIDLSRGEIFLSFLAGFVDSDGSIIVRKSGNYFQFVVRIFNQNVGLIDTIKNKLIDMHFRPSVYINAKKGKIKRSKHSIMISNKDDFVVELYKKDDVIKLLKCLPVKHPEKRLWKDLIFELHKDNVIWHKVAEPKLSALRQDIETNVRNSVNHAKEEYLLRR